MRSLMSAGIEHRDDVDLIDPSGREWREQSCSAGWTISMRPGGWRCWPASASLYWSPMTTVKANAGAEPSARAWLLEVNLFCWWRPAVPGRVDVLQGALLSTCCGLLEPRDAEDGKGDFG